MPCGHSLRHDWIGSASCNSISMSIFQTLRNKLPKGVYRRHLPCKTIEVFAFVCSVFTEAMNARSSISSDECGCLQFSVKAYFVQPLASVRAAITEVIPRCGFERYSSSANADGVQSDCEGKSKALLMI